MNSLPFKEIHGHGLGAAEQKKPQTHTILKPWPSRILVTHLTCAEVYPSRMWQGPPLLWPGPAHENQVGQSRNPVFFSWEWRNQEYHQSPLLASVSRGELLPPFI